MRISCRNSSVQNENLHASPRDIGSFRASTGVSLWKIEIMLSTLRCPFGFGILILSGCTPVTPDASKAPERIPLVTVSDVDLHRYAGDWRVIANIPYFAERGCVDSIESYRLRSDGKIENIFTFRKASFDAPQKQVRAVATITNRKTNAEWRVKFFGLLSFDYFIVDLDPNYQWAAIAHPSRKYGWILARSKSLPERTYTAILKRLEKLGYRSNQFAKVPQLP